MPSDISPSKLQEHAATAAVPSAAVIFMECDEISLLDLLIILAERKRIILAITTVFAIVAVVGSLALSSRYTATVTLLPPQQSSSMASALVPQLGSMGDIVALTGSSRIMKSPNDMYVAMFKSRTVEDAMVQHFGLMQEYRVKLFSDARKAFEDSVTVDGSGKDGLIRISVVDRAPWRAAELANGYVDQFRLQSQHLASTEASRRRAFFEGQLEQAKDSLANAEEGMERTEQKSGVIQLDSQTRSLLESAASLRAQVAAKEVQIRGLRTYTTGENPQLMRTQQELGNMRTQLARLGGSANKTSGGLIVSSDQIAEGGLEYARKFRDVKYSEEILDIMARQFEAAKLDEARQGSLIQVVDAAVPAEQKSGPRRSLIVIGFTGLGFFCSVLYVLLCVSFERMSFDPKYLAQFTQLREILFRRKMPCCSEVVDEL